MRPITSYAKFQKYAGMLIRNRRFQLSRRRVRQCEYLDVGCGPNTHDAFINVDFQWHPKIDVCWDISRGLPFASDRFRGILSEHVLEHFPLLRGEKLLREMARVLRPDGTLRLIVPDGERYIQTYNRWRAGDQSVRFPYQPFESVDGLWTPMLSVNRLFYHDRQSLYGHWVTYDFELLSAVLRRCGFGNVERREYQQGADPQLLIDTPSRRAESLYVEATKARP